MPYIKVVKKKHACYKPPIDPEHDAGTVWECPVCNCRWRLTLNMGAVDQRDSVLYWREIGVFAPR